MSVGAGAALPDGHRWLELVFPRSKVRVLSRFVEPTPFRWVNNLCVFVCFGLYVGGVNSRGRNSPSLDILVRGAAHVAAERSIISSCDVCPCSVHVRPCVDTSQKPPPCNLESHPSTWCRFEKDVSQHRESGICSLLFKNQPFQVEQEIHGLRQSSGPHTIKKFLEYVSHLAFFPFSTVVPPSL